MVASANLVLKSSVPLVLYHARVLKCSGITDAGMQSHLCYPSIRAASCRARLTSVSGPACFYSPVGLALAKGVGLFGSTGGAYEKRPVFPFQRWGLQNPKHRGKKGKRRGHRAESPK